MQYGLVATALISAVLSLGACNTMQGLGRDLEAGGRAVARTAAQTQADMQATRADIAPDTVAPPATPLNAIQARARALSARPGAVEKEEISSDGARTQQQWEFTTPSVQVTAHAAGVTQVRSSGGQYNGFCQQGGIEVLERARFRQDAGPRVKREALELVGAAVCPGGTMDIILMPDQMTLQIHESIGHPLELDRILGDERMGTGTVVDPAGLILTALPHLAGARLRTPTATEVIEALGVSRTQAYALRARIEAVVPTCQRPPGRLQ